VRCLRDIRDRRFERVADGEPGRRSARSAAGILRFFPRHGLADALGYSATGRPSVSADSGSGRSLRTVHRRNDCQCDDGESAEGPGEWLSATAACTPGSTYSICARGPFVPPTERTAVRWFPRLARRHPRNDPLRVVARRGENWGVLHPLRLKHLLFATRRSCGRCSTASRSRFAATRTRSARGSVRPLKPIDFTDNIAACGWRWTWRLVADRFGAGPAASPATRCRRTPRPVRAVQKARACQCGGPPTKCERRRRRRWS